MIEIEHIRMHLPAGFEHRASSIAHFVGQALSWQPVAQDACIETLSIPRQKILLTTSDAEIANMIAEKIISSYQGVSEHVG